jgi:hypothetical protein
MLMQPFAIVDANGRQVMAGTSPQTPACPDGCQILATMPPTPSSFWDFASGTWQEPLPQPSPRHLFDWGSHSWVDVRTLDEVKADQQSVINAEGRRRASALVAGYPDFERQTWPSQEREALAWQADPSSPTPYLDGIAAARGISAREMRVKTLEAVLAFRQASQYLVGTRQALRDQIAAAPTVQAVQAVAWPSETPTSEQP